MRADFRCLSQIWFSFRIRLLVVVAVGKPWSFRRPRGDLLSDLSVEGFEDVGHRLDENTLTPPTFDAHLVGQREDEPFRREFRVVE
jgi:hypothetical protein